MTFDGIMTRSIVRELENTIVGGHVKKINQINPHVLVLQIYQGANYVLYLSADSNQPRFHLTHLKYENPKTPPNFCMLLRKHLQSAKLLSIEQIGMDRTVLFHFSGYDELGVSVEKTLAVEIMGKHSNIILLQDGKVLDAMKRVSHDMSRVRQIYPGKQYEIFPSEKRDPLTEEIHVRQILRDAKETISVFKVFYQQITGFSPTISREICARADIVDTTPVGQLRDVDIDALDESLQHVLDQIHTDTFQPLLYRGSPQAYYCMPLTYLGRAAEEFDTMGELLDRFFLETNPDDRLGQRKGAMSAIMENVLHKKYQKLTALQSDLRATDDREIYLEEGDLLSAVVHTLQKGQSSVTVDDFYHDGNPREISLDPKKSAWENVETKYKRHSKLKTARAILERSIPALQRELDYLEQLHHDVRHADSLETLQQIREEMEEQGLVKRQGKRKKVRQESALKPHHFVTRSGMDVYVGRNNTQNDKLTLRFADKEDFFLHAKDIPGSHVILRTNGQTPAEEDLIDAAWLAGKNSKNGDQDYVDVDYTKKKNVYKAKGAKPGMVYYNDFGTMRIDLTADLGLKEIEN